MHNINTLEGGEGLVTNTTSEKVKQKHESKHRRILNMKSSTKFFNNALSKPNSFCKSTLRTLAV